MSFQVLERFRKKFLEQLDFLLSSAEQYDKGRTDEALRMATSMRILFHDNLIGQIGGKRSRLVSTCDAVDARTVRYHGLVKFVVRDGKHAVEPVLEDRPIEGTATLEIRGLRLQTHGPIITPSDTPTSDPNAIRYLRVNKWWNEIVFVFSPNVTLTRREIALEAANTDGGAHVDREIDRKYSRLVEGSLDFFVGRRPRDPEPFKFSSVHLAALRQMTFEILNSRELFSLADKELKR
jgi:hypothetical protein